MHFTPGNSALSCDNERQVFHLEELVYRIVRPSRSTVWESVDKDNYLEILVDLERKVCNKENLFLLT